jgi:hypothetical protein
MGTSPRRAFTLAVTIAAAGALGAAPPAQPAAAETPISAFASGPGTTATESPYLAGYQVTKPGISRASVTFDVPTVSCPSSDAQGTAAGIGNEQVAGAPTLLATVWNACTGGSPVQQMHVLAGGNEDFEPVAPGDRIRVVIVQTPTRVRAKVTDSTGGATATATGTPTPDNSLTFGTFPLFAGGQLPVADFATVRMRRPLLDSADVSTLSPTRLKRKNGDTIQVRTGVIGPTGAFTQYFVSN